MNHGQKPAPAMQTARVELTSADWQLRTTISVSKGPMAVRELLPVAQALADEAVKATIGSVEEGGKKISCRKGCGACCRQLVPIAETEAGHIRDLVNRLPEPRQAEIRRRFEEGGRRLEQAGLLDRLLRRDSLNEGDVQSLGLSYFFQGIPCPFLEAESCSIHADRPISCREYLVTSPAENCAQPGTATIEQVPVPFKFWTALAGFDRVEPPARFIRWVPLILALDWTEANPVEPAERPGPELLRELVEHLSTGKRRTIEEPQKKVECSAPGASLLSSAESAACVIEPASGVSVSRNPEPDPDLPLRLGAAQDFARVASTLRTARFDEATICQFFGIQDMSDIGSVQKDKVHLTGLLGLLLKLFLFMEPVPRWEIEGLMNPASLTSFVSLDLIRAGGASSITADRKDIYYCPVWLYPVAGCLVVSDRRKSLDDKEIPPREDVVFPAIYEGTLRFLRVIPKSAAVDALDLCSGTGIAALVMGRSTRRIVACDVTARASHFAEFNRRLNDCNNVEVVTGDLYSAVENQSFDRIVAHPPFVPGKSHALIYRDSGENGEALLKRIIEGLPRYLRPGGSFFGICAAWDSKDGSFEERARGWLGKERDQFDVIFALQRQLSPDDVAGRVAELSAPDGMSRAGWSELFRNAGFESNVYGAIVMRRSRAGEALCPVTQRVRLGNLTDGSALERALGWYSWRKRNETRGDFVSAVCSMRPRLSPHLKAQVTHEVGQGSLVPTDVVLEVDQPFPSACRVDPWMLHLLAEFDGQRTAEAVREAAKKVLPFPESFAVEDFARIVANMIERGCLEIEDDALGQQVLKNSGPVSRGSA